MVNFINDKIIEYIESSIQKSSQQNQKITLTDHLFLTLLEQTDVQELLTQQNPDIDLDFVSKSIEKTIEKNNPSFDFEDRSRDLSVYIKNVVGSVLKEMQQYNLNNKNQIMMENNVHIIFNKLLLSEIIKLNTNDHITSHILYDQGINGPELASSIKENAQFELEALSATSNHSNQDTDEEPDPTEPTETHIIFEDDSDDGSEDDKENGHSKNSKKDKKSGKEALIETGYVEDMLEDSEHYRDLVGHEKTIKQISQTLARQNKHNIILVGEPGVGKTALVQGIAKRIKNNQLAGFFDNAEMYSLNLVQLMSGAHFRGELEKRINDIVEILEERKAFLFIDEIHALVSATQGQSAGISISDTLKPILDQSNIRIIGTTTYDEKKKVLDYDLGFERRFQFKYINEPDHEQTLDILEGIVPSLSDYHNVAYDKKSLASTIQLAGQYLTQQQFPDKAIDILDEAGAKHSSVFEHHKTIQKNDIEQIISEFSGVELGELTKTDKERLMNFESDLSQRIIGQDNAIQQISQAIRMGRTGLAGQEKPVGNYVLAGPTGVGKTELVKQVADLLNIDTVRFDMSEYIEKHSVSKLIGAPPGYLGHETGGLLTEQINKHPHSILLLDEVEKAHPDIMKVLLQIMSDGVLTDSQGKQTNFKNTILMMTTNLGVHEANVNNIGFTKDLDGDSYEKRMSAIKEYFQPEFINRLDSIIFFNSLTKNNMKDILEKEIQYINHTRLKNQNITIELTSKAKEMIIDKGFSNELGARPMQRVINENIMAPLADKIIFENIEQGHIKCKVEQGQIVLETLENHSSAVDDLLSSHKIIGQEEDNKKNGTTMG